MQAEEEGARVIELPGKMPGSDRISSLEDVCKPPEPNKSGIFAYSGAAIDGALSATGCAIGNAAGVVGKTTVNVFDFGKKKRRASAQLMAVLKIQAAFRARSARNEATALRAGTRRSVFSFLGRRRSAPPTAKQTPSSSARTSSDPAKGHEQMSDETVQMKNKCKQRGGVFAACGAALDTTVATTGSGFGVAFTATKGGVTQIGKTAVQVGKGVSETTASVATAAVTTVDFVRRRRVREAAIQSKAAVRLQSVLRGRIARRKAAAQKLEKKPGFLNAINPLGSPSDPTKGVHLYDTKRVLELQKRRRLAAEAIPITKLDSPLPCETATNPFILAHVLVSRSPHTPHRPYFFCPANATSSRRTIGESLHVRYRSTQGARCMRSPA